MDTPYYERTEACGQEREEDEEEEEMDPRIRVELESLNQAASDVNCLEKEIDEARTKYQTTFSEKSVELEGMKNKIEGKIRKSRPYYELKELAKEAQSEALRSARKFQSANSVYLAAKETISLAELRLMDEKAANLSTAWQEMLNHAVLRVMEAEKEKSKNEQEHLQKAAEYAEMEKKLHLMEKKYKKSIEKSKSYFESKNELELKLQQIKQTIEDLQLAMQSAKRRYSNSLKRLETISDGIHEVRRKKLMLMYPREPGVGAEDGVINEELPTVDDSLKNHLRDTDYLDTDSQISIQDEEDSDEDIQDDESCDEDCTENEFRQKVLTHPIDSEESIFKKSRRHQHRTMLTKSRSLPTFLNDKHEIIDVSSVFDCVKSNSREIIKHSEADVDLTEMSEGINPKNEPQCQSNIIHQKISHKQNHTNKPPIKARGKLSGMQYLDVSKLNDFMAGQDQGCYD